MPENNRLPRFLIFGTSLSALGLLILGCLWVLLPTHSTVRTKDASGQTVNLTTPTGLNLGTLISLPPPEKVGPVVTLAGTSSSLGITTSTLSSTGEISEIGEKVGARALPGPPPNYKVNPLHNEIKPLGLQNHGNTCYFNSITQCLAAMYHLLGVDTQSFDCFPPFKFYLESLRQIRGLSPVPPTTTYIPLRSSLTAFQNYKKFSEISRELFIPGPQQDSLEPFVFMMDQSYVDCPNFLRNNELRLTLRKRMTCQQCLHTKVAEEEGTQFLILTIQSGGLDQPVSLAQLRELIAQARPDWSNEEAAELHRRYKEGPIPMNDPAVQKAMSQKGKVEAELTPPLTLERLLNEYFSAKDMSCTWQESRTRRGFLENESCQYCGKCSSVSSIHEFILDSWPTVLGIQFQRLAAVASRSETAVKVPEYLEPTPGKIYRFLATSLHSGSAHGGHYTAVVRYGNNYWYMNDTSSSPCTFESHVAENPNMLALFYELISSN